MSLHLFLDVVAWFLGIVFTLNAIEMMGVKYGRGITLNKWRALVSVILATLCWAWIIAS